MFPKLFPLCAYIKHLLRKQNVFEKISQLFSVFFNFKIQNKLGFLNTVPSFEGASEFLKAIFLYLSDTSSLLNGLFLDIA